MSSKHLSHAILVCALAAGSVIAGPAVPSLSNAAVAQGIAISVEFRTALSPYGAWRSVPRWGEVWVPARRDRDWRPYTIGQWVYSDDYGWYWIAADEEAEWGWVTYHYGRWVDVDTVGWVWIPGNVWGPAWVDWRRGDDFVGWAPLPPDEVIVEYRTDPRFWMFVNLAELISPRPRFVFAPISQRASIWQRTVVVNRTVVLSDRRFAVNPGIAPAIVAAAARRPMRTFTVRPQVVAGTANIEGATVVRADDLRRGGNRPGRTIAQSSAPQQTSNTIQPAKNVPAPQALGQAENGRLGDDPPRAARGAQERGTTGNPPGTTGAAPPSQRQDQPRREERGPAGAPPNATGATPPSQRETPRREAPAQREERGSRGTPPGTTGAAPPSQREAPAQREERGSTGAASPNQRETPRREAPPQRDERGSRGTPPGTTGAAPPSQREAPAQREERGSRGTPPGTTGAAPPSQRETPRREAPPQREERGTTGAAPPTQREAPAQRQEPRGAPPATTGAAPPRQAPPPAPPPQEAPKQHDEQHKQK